MCRMLSLITMLAVLFLTQASAQYSYNEDKMRRCSDGLNEMLMMACEAFNVITSQKRGIIAGDLDLLDPVQFVEAKESHPIFRGRFHGGDGALNSLTPIRRLTRQGIVDRCCKASCPTDAFKEYCSIPRI